MTLIGLLGDTHGNTHVVQNALDMFLAHDVIQIHQVGDFGFWPGKPGEQFLAQVNTHLTKNGQTLYITPGNHEDYSQIKHFPVREDGWLEAREHILVAPRGHRWEWEGVSFVSLGGAPSVDRAWRIQFQRDKGYPVWWKEEDISREDMDLTIEGGYADIMIAHDAPFGVPTVEKGISGNPMGFTEEDLRYGYEGRLKMREVVDVIRPKMFFHGHYHFKVEDKLEIFNENTGVDDVTRIIGLSADGVPNSWGILDLSTHKFRWGASF